MGNDHHKTVPIQDGPTHSPTHSPTHPPIAGSPQPCLAHIDVDRFVQLLLHAHELQPKIHAIHRALTRVSFYLPARGTTLLASGAALLAGFDHICFVESGSSDSPATRQCLSWAGLPITHSGDVVCVFPRVFPHTSDFVDILLSGDHPRKSAFFAQVFRDASGSAQRVMVKSGFTVEADALECAVYVVDAETVLGLDEHPEMAPTPSADSLQLASHLLTGQEALIARLRHPDSAPIVAQIKKLLGCLVSAKTAMEKSRLAQALYATIEQQLRSTLLWTQLPKDEIDAAMDGIERYVFTKIHRAYACPWPAHLLASLRQQTRTTHSRTSVCSTRLLPCAT